MFMKKTTKLDLQKEIEKMEQIIDYLLEAFDNYPGLYGTLRYYFTQSDYTEMLNVIENRIKKGE